MADHNYYFTPEIDSELNELRIDSIRENKEMTEQQPELDAYFIYSDDKGNYQTYMTDGMKKFVRE